ncbi:GGDEF domain-containing protein [Gilvimarinus xylanilyticus]|uniref:diguanylate cyclase n=1 Tax=Gilvimarinus xylanilyticus TaxID=2944139 RepID=A0A9X2I1P5_9GAMM|nr:GGDEF domain-containing protein [Gilvimarinus xylanilyticus]MCP8900511.1 GGDEF domain-containing protein [Gilvimarinus xylanilyticus]
MQKIAVLKIKLGRGFLLLLLLLTLFLLALPKVLPERELVLLPDNNANRFLYDDQEIGGGNRVEWLDQSNNHWRCTRDIDKSSHFCGYNLALSDDFTRGIDFSAYQKIRYEVDFNTSSSQITLFLRNYNPVYSNPDDGNSAQYIHFFLKPQDLSSVITIDFNEFRLAEWWLSGRGLAREDRSPQFNNITLLGINLGSDLSPGNHDVVIKRIALRGPWVSAETWYLALLLVWLVGAIGVLSIKMIYHHRQASMARHKYSTLHERHRELHDRAQELTDLSQRDALSGLFNRHGLSLALAPVLKSGKGYAVVVLDIDHFKRINDRRGHLEGDQILVQVAQLTQNEVRADDIVARWGGEEFVIVLPGAGTEEAYKLAERIRYSVFNARFFQDKKLIVSVSLGISHAQPGADNTFEPVFNRADQALYKAKELGRNCTVIDGEPQR